MSTLQDLPREQVATRLDGYMAAHPQQDSEMNGIRQPLTDIKARCGGLDAAPSEPWNAELRTDRDFGLSP
jgi:heme-binding protein